MENPARRDRRRPRPQGGADRRGDLRRLLPALGNAAGPSVHRGSAGIPGRHPAGKPPRRTRRDLPGLRRIKGTARHLVLQRRCRTFGLQQLDHPRHLDSRRGGLPALQHECHDRCEGLRHRDPRPPDSLHHQSHELAQCRRRRLRGILQLGRRPGLLVPELYRRRGGHRDLPRDRPHPRPLPSRLRYQRILRRTRQRRHRLGPDHGQRLREDPQTLVGRQLLSRHPQEPEGPHHHHQSERRGFPPGRLRQQPCRRPLSVDRPWQRGRQPAGTRRDPRRHRRLPLQDQRRCDQSECHHRVEFLQPGHQGGHRGCGHRHGRAHQRLRRLGECRAGHHATRRRISTARHRGFGRHARHHPWRLFELRVPRILSDRWHGHRRRNPSGLHDRGTQRQRHEHRHRHPARRLRQPVELHHRQWQYRRHPRPQPVHRRPHRREFHCTGFRNALSTVRRPCPVRAVRHHCQYQHLGDGNRAGHRDGQ